MLVKYSPISAVMRVSTNVFSSFTASATNLMEPHHLGEALS